MKSSLPSKTFVVFTAPSLLLMLMVLPLLRTRASTAFPHQSLPLFTLHRSCAQNLRRIRSRLVLPVRVIQTHVPIRNSRICSQSVRRRRSFFVKVVQQVVLVHEHAQREKPLHTICKCAPGVICVCDRRSHDGERMSDTRGGGAPVVLVVLVLALVVVPLVVPFAVVDEGPPRGCSRPPDMIDAAQRCRSPKVGRTDGGSRGVRFKR